MEVFLNGLLPRLMPTTTFDVIVFQGKPDLLNKLPSRLAGYAPWMPPDWRIVVLIDRDDDDCKLLKDRLEEAVLEAGLTSKRTSSGEPWRVATRIAIEELEAWYFGDWPSVVEAFDRLPTSVPMRRGFRDSDEIRGGTWEALERIFAKAGYFREGLPKRTVARAVAEHFREDRCLSPSFRQFRNALLEATA